MQILSEAEMLEAIRSSVPFEAKLSDGSLQIKIEEWTPYLATAIHAGARVRPEVAKHCALTRQKRLQEEDPFTDALISSCPITLIGLDSRYEYDLNRTPEECVHEIAWKQKVWRGELPAELKDQSRAKHATYYRILDALIHQVQQQTGGCLVIDLHSYNYKIRTYPFAPVFNIGTFRLDVERWGRVIETLERGLDQMALPGVETTVRRDEVFQGKGYQAQYVQERFPDVPVIPLEIKKVFMDERTGEVYPCVLESLQTGLSTAIQQVGSVYARGLEKYAFHIRPAVARLIEPIALKVDREIYRMSHKIDTLHYVNPINYQQEKKAFFSRRNYTPAFQYRQLGLDPYSFREQLYALPVSQIQDRVLKRIYRSLVDNFAKKIDLITTIGTPQFLYNSLRYYGEPSMADSANASFLLHIKNVPGAPPEGDSMTPEDAKRVFEKALADYQIDFQVQITSRIVAKAMVDSKRRQVQINSHAKMKNIDLQALLHHEFGIHVLTTINSEQQPLRLFELGMPGNTETQEGLAILSEYLSGNLTLRRLRLLALRVIAIRMLVDGESFQSVFQFLVDRYGLDTGDAFDLTARVFRGGGFTKDYVYLSGFSRIMAMYRRRSLTPLMIGKTSLRYLNDIDNLMDRGILSQPKHLPPIFGEGVREECNVMNFIVRNIEVK